MSRTIQKPVEQVSHRRLFLLLAALNLVAIGWAVWDETRTRRPWKQVQDDFNQVLADRGLPEEAIRIRQVANPELGVVDRCQTCHLGIDRADLDGADVPAVFRAHPRRAALLGTRHPVERFGCTICHLGQGAQIKGIGWRDFDHGRDDPYWDTPMAEPVFAQAACVACHSGDGPIAGAEIFERGRALFVDRRCFGCHDAAFVDPGFEAAPPLDRLTVKSPPGVIAAWLRDPAGFRPGTAMPSFWPAPVRPDGSPQPDGSPARQAWQDQREREIGDILAFLAALPAAAPLPAAPAVDQAAAVRGRQLFDAAGCRGCHATGDAGPGWQSTFAPDLSRIGEKASAAWLAAWLADPAALWPGTRMPHPRLTDDERALLVAYLVSLRTTGTPPASPAWPPPDPARAASGRRLVQSYGCTGCHAIPGIEPAGKPGPDLTAFGDRTSDFLTWGEAEVVCGGPTLPCWTEVKLRQPRRLGGKRLALSMPDSRLDAADAEALAVFLMAQRARVIPEGYRRVPPPRERDLARGEALLARHNCRGCHEVGRGEKVVVDEDGEKSTEFTPHGGDVRRFYAQPWEAPPPLTFAGKKFRYDWLFDFLAEPVSIRPWLVARMPRFHLPDADREALVRYFAVASDQPYPFAADHDPVLADADRPAAQALFRDFQCAKCHQISGATGLQPGELAPDLARTSRRLRPGWMRAWLLDPQQLYPGTKMPTYFPVEDEDQPDVRVTPCPDCFGGDIGRQIEALAGALWEL